MISYIADHLDIGEPADAESPPYIHQRGSLDRPRYSTFSTLQQRLFSVAPYRIYQARPD